MNIKKNSLVLIVLLFSYSLIAQEVLTKKEAIEIALKNNYGIKIANNNLKVSNNNTSIYNTGFLPTLSTTAGANYRNENQEITRQDGNTTNIEGAVTKSYNASVSLNYTIFDGLGRKYNYQRLKETYNLTKLEARETIENTYLQIFTLYFQVARLTENNQNLAEVLKISKERVKRSEYQYEYGQSSKLAFLNAKVDMNNDSIIYINNKQQLLNAKRDLNIVLGTDKDVSYEVETAISFQELKNFEDIYSKTKENNVSLKQRKKNLAINDLNIKFAKSNYLPTLDLTSSYNWNQSENPPTSFLAGINSNGLNAGLRLSWNVFDGGITKTRVTNAKITQENQQILLEQQEETLKNTLKNNWGNYQNQLFVLKVQEENVLTSQNNFDRTLERFKLGQVTSIEFRQAQLNLLNTKASLNNAKYNAKLSEIQLLQLSGEILNMNF